MLANLTLKSRIFFSFLVYIAFLSLPGCLATAYFYRNPAKFIQIPQTTDYLDRGLIADRLSRSQVKIQESILGYVSTKDDSFLNYSQQNYLNFNQEIQWLNDAASTGRIDDDFLPNIHQLIQRLQKLNQSILNLSKAGKYESAIRVISADENRQLFRSMSEELDRMRTAEIKWQTAKAEERRTAIRTLILLVGLATSFIALLAIALSFPLAKRILVTADELMSKLLNVSGAIGQEINDHERNIHQQAQMVSTTIPQLQDLIALGSFSTEKTASVYLKIEEISANLPAISHQISQLKSLVTMSETLVYQSKRISANLIIKSSEETSDNSKSFGLLNTELRRLTDRARDIAQQLNEIVSLSAIVEPTISINLPTWGGNASEYAIANKFLTDNLASQPSEPIERVLTAVEQIKIDISELELCHQQQAAIAEKIWQTNEQLDRATGTTVCGLSETNIQAEKCQQIALNMQRFLGDV